MANIGGRDLLLLLIGLGEEDGLRGAVSGITRLQKLLFLLQQETGVAASGGGFDFEPYKAGPYSSRLYDDLEFLENLGLIRSEATAESAVTDDADSSVTETIDIDRLSFEDLIGGFEQLDGGSRAIDSFQERRFTLTSKGRVRVQAVLETPGVSAVVDGVRMVKSRYGRHSLRDLLRYVYEKYPEMTRESEIIEKVLGRRGRDAR